MQKPARKEWRVWPTSGEQYSVFADDLKLTAAGDAIFQTYTPGAIVEGNQSYEVNVALVLRNGTWDRFEQFTNGVPLHQQSGQVSLAA